MIDVATLSVIRRWALREQLSIREIGRGNQHAAYLLPFNAGLARTTRQGALAARSMISLGAAARRKGGKGRKRQWLRGFTCRDSQPSTSGWMTLPSQRMSLNFRPAVASRNTDSF